MGIYGVVVSDWGAVNDRVLGLRNGNDLEMPSSFGRGTSKIVNAISSGVLEESILDKSVERILQLILKSTPVFQQEFSFDSQAHHDLARKIASESIVLLKNDGILPLSRTQRIAVVGDMAKKPRYQGAGSSMINPIKVDNFVEILERENVSFSENFEDAEAVLLFIGLTEEFESEGFDRTTLSIPDEHIQLVQQISSVNPNLVVVLSGGSAIEMPWIAQVKGLLHTFLPGQAGAGAIFDVLFGVINPSGKLAESFPFSLDDCSATPNFPGNQLTVEYRESIFVGYRYYEKVEKPVLFHFGFGLSYTTFEYSDLISEKESISSAETLNITFKIKNTGSLAGAEITQIYVHHKESSVYRPIKELKGFSKVFLQPTEEQSVLIPLDSRSFAYWNPSCQDWYVESGEFEILIGASSQDIRLRSVVLVVNENPIPPPQYPVIYASGDPKEATSVDFEALLGYQLPPSSRLPGEPLTLVDNFELASDTKWGARINKMIRKIIESKDFGPYGTMITAVILQTPFRSLISMSGGLITEEMANGLIQVLNGESASVGFFRIIKGLPCTLR